MTRVLILAEKPSSAEKIALSLSEGKARKKAEKKVAYYEFEKDGKQFVVVPAVGHLYSLAEKKKSSGYPVFEVEWKPSSEVSESAEFSKAYLQSILSLSKSAKEFVAATDYDLEGEVIAGNVMEFACRQPAGKVKRMKFSTLTSEELLESFEKVSPTMDLGLLDAGRTRHEMDFYWGISLSRALMTAIKQAGRFQIMSVGRVQGPALAVLARREQEVTSFVPTPYWQVFALIEKVVFENTTFKAMKQRLDLLKGAEAELQRKIEALKFAFVEKETVVDERTPLPNLEKKIREVSNELEKVAERIGGEKLAQSVVDNAKGAATISKVERKKFKQLPPFPFDLTTLQTEAYKAFSFSPTQTLDIAQNLYEQAAISYPRTASQKLPEKLNLPKIISKLSSNPAYSKHASQLLDKKRFKPHEGKREDPAHPAIFPTGEKPGLLSGQQSKLYDLIVKRFLACFAPPAVREKMTVEATVGSEVFRADGARTLEPGWVEFYSPYAKFEEISLPDFVPGRQYDVDKVWKEKKMTQPPPRFTEASLIRKLEAEDLGTKATRAAIIKTLFDRGYVRGKSIEVTPLGMSVFEALHGNVPQILSDELTRHFEEQIEAIQAGEKKSSEVLEEGRETLSKLCEEFRDKEKTIGEKLLAAVNQTQRQQSVLGQCNLCNKGDLVLRKSKYGMFVGCSSYPECRNTFPLPREASVKAAGKTCEKCGTPIVWVRRKGRRPFSMCLLPTCETKKDWSKSQAGQQENTNENKDEANKK